jgi:DNA repair exonuclease SbcCD ATPase subunit
MQSAKNETRSKTEEETLSRAVERLKLLRSQRDTESNLIQSLKFRCETANKVAEIVKDTAQAIQETAHRQIATIVTDCFRTIFEMDWTFELRFEQKRNKTEARPVLLDPQGNEYDPMNDCGGGIIDVLSFGLRVACLVLSQPTYRRILILDEPFKFVSVEYRANIAALIKKLSDDLDIQFIIVTHLRDFHLGKVVRIQ